MIVRMGRAQNTGPDSPVDKPPDVQVTSALPTSLTTFVGRARELDELRSLFREGKRLVTLVGIGGIGKTRLALELGSSASDLGWTNVYLAELASLTADLVDSAVLESVGGGSSRSPLKAAVEYLRDVTILLVLDCCEHVLDAVRHAAEVLLHRCPSVVILATSRSPIRIAGELVWAVPSLSMQARGDAGETGASDAARLFADRASYVQSRFELSEDAAGAVETIVRRVNGIPLEAAAAVCAGGAIAGGQVLDEIEGLVDNSLLAVERGPGATRFRMLDFVCQYAAERLVAAGEGDLLADRHRRAESTTHDALKVLMDHGWRPLVLDARTSLGSCLCLVIR
jgi:predicted ATPase